MDEAEKGKRERSVFGGTCVYSCMLGARRCWRARPRVRRRLALIVVLLLALAVMVAVVVVVVEPVTTARKFCPGVGAVPAGSRLTSADALAGGRDSVEEEGLAALLSRLQVRTAASSTQFLTAAATATRAPAAVRTRRGLQSCCCIQRCGGFVSKQCRRLTPLCRRRLSTGAPSGAARR